MDSYDLCGDLYGINIDSFTSVGSSPILVRFNDPVMVDEREKAKNPAELDPTPVETSVLNTKQQIEEILNSIIPPRCLEDNGNMWKETVSTNPATKQDVINLQYLMDSELEKAGAHKTGLCIKRRDIYTQCFDEIIRQVTINCADRGLLLTRIRDEIKKTFDAYAKKYCDEISCVVQGCFENRLEEEKLYERIEALEAEKEVLEQRVIKMQSEMDEEERRNTEMRFEAKWKHGEEVALLKKKYSQLRAKLEDNF